MWKGRGAIAWSDAGPTFIEFSVPPRRCAVWCPPARQEQCSRADSKSGKTKVGYMETGRLRACETLDWSEVESGAHKSEMCRKHRLLIAVVGKKNLGVGACISPFSSYYLPEWYFLIIEEDSGSCAKKARCSHDLRIGWLSERKLLQKPSQLSNNCRLRQQPE